MCTKRMARPTLSRMTMQIMMVLGPWKRRQSVRALSDTQPNELNLHQLEENTPIVT